MIELDSHVHVAHWVWYYNIVLSLPDNTMAAKWLATQSQQQSTGSWDHQ